MTERTRLQVSWKFMELLLFAQPVAAVFANVIGQHGGVWCPQSAGQELQPLLLHKLQIGKKPES